MTRNQLEYAKLKETVRHNIATEGLTAKNLAEVIANNLRTHQVAVGRLQLDKLVNDRLDDRERQKLAETIRANLAKELENNRHNMNDEDIRRTQNAINSLKSKYEPGPLIAALLGLMSDEDLARIYGDAVPKAKKSLENNTNNVFDSISNFILSDAMTGSTQSHYKVGKAAGKKQSFQAWMNINDRDLNEISMDHSNSYGPGLVTNQMIQNRYQRESQKYDAPIGPAVPSANNDFAISLPDKQGNVIYHPSVKRENIGPGFQVPGI